MSSQSASQFSADNKSWKSNEPILDDSTERAPDVPSVFTASQATPAHEKLSIPQAPSNIPQIHDSSSSVADRALHSVKDAMTSIGQKATEIKDAVLGYHPDENKSTSSTTTQSEIAPMHHIIHSEEEPIHSVKPLNENELPDERGLYEPSFGKKAQAALSIVGRKFSEVADTVATKFHDATHKTSHDQDLHINESDEQFHLQMQQDKERAAKQGHHDVPIEIVTPDGQHTIIDADGNTRVFQGCTFAERPTQSDPQQYFAPAADNTSIPVPSSKSQSSTSTTSDKLHLAAEKVENAAIYAKERIVTEAAVIGGYIANKSTEAAHVASLKASELAAATKVKATEFGHQTSDYVSQGVTDLKAQAKFAGHDASVKTAAFGHAVAEKTAEVATNVKNYATAKAHQAADYTSAKAQDVKVSATEMASQAKDATVKAASKAKEATISGASSSAAYLKQQANLVTHSDLQKPPSDLDKSPIKHVTHNEEEPIRAVPFDESVIAQYDESRMDHSGTIMHNLALGAKLAVKKVSASAESFTRSIQSHSQSKPEENLSDKEFHDQIHHDILQASKQPKDVPFELVLGPNNHLPIRDEFAPIDTNFQSRHQPALLHADAPTFVPQMDNSKFTNESGLLEEKTQEA